MGTRGNSMSLRYRMFRILRFVAIFGVAVAGFYAAPVRDRCRPRLVVAENELTFGASEPSKAATKTVEIRNDGDRTLRVFSVTTTCGCTRASLEKRILAPGEKAPVTVSLDGERGALSAFVIIRSNDPIEPLQSIHVKSPIKNKIYADPSGLTFFGGGRDPLPQTKRVLLRFTDYDTFRQHSRVTTQIDSNWLSVSATRDEANGRYELNITLPAGVPRGVMKSSLRISDTRGSFHLTVPIETFVESRYWKQRSALVVGPPEAGESEWRQSFILQRLAHVQSARIRFDPTLGKIVRGEYSDVANNASARIEVRANRPAKIGPRDGPRLPDELDGHVFIETQGEPGAGSEVFALPVMLLLR